MLLWLQQHDFTIRYHQDHEMLLANALHRLPSKLYTDEIHLDMHANYIAFSDVRLQQLYQEKEQCIAPCMIYMDVTMDGPKSSTVFPGLYTITGISKTS